MKTIEEAAKDYAISLIVDDCHLTRNQIEEYAQTDFKKGVEFAQRWIPVEESYPPQDELILVKFMIAGTVNDIACVEIDCEETVHYRGDEAGISFNYITHWRPIELR